MSDIKFLELTDSESKDLSDYQKVNDFVKIKVPDGSYKLGVFFNFLDELTLGQCALTEDAEVEYNFLSKDKDAGPKVLQSLKINLHNNIYMVTRNPLRDKELLIMMPVSVDVFISNTSIPVKKNA